MAGKAKVRLIEIALTKQQQGRGLGKQLLVRLLQRMKRNGYKTLTFRTPINEAAKDFWLHIGAEIKGVKQNDFEMEIKLK